MDSVAKIKSSFPALPLSFYDVLIDRLRANSFSDQRLRDAVAHVADTCVYPTPTIAQFISFDKTYKAYTLEEMYQLVHEQKIIWKGNYFKVRLPGVSQDRFVHKGDIKHYKHQEYLLNPEDFAAEVEQKIK